MRTEFYYLSSDGKTNIHALEYIPDTGTVIKGIVQIEHGMSENCEIYEPVAEALAENGFAVRLHDHIGHGLSARENEKRNYFGEKGSREFLLQDMHALRTRRLQDGAEADRPYFLLGHSLGAFLSREYLIRYGDVDGALISGSSVQNAIAIQVIRSILKRETAKNGYDSDSDFVQSILHGANNRKLKGASSVGFDWLLKDPEARKIFTSGGHIGGKVIAGSFLELTDSMLYSQKKENLRKIPKATSVLFVAGAEDASVNFGKDLPKTAELYKSCGLQDVACRIYENGRHCIFQDYCKEEVIRDTVRVFDEWAEKKSPSSAM